MWVLLLILISSAIAQQDYYADVDMRIDYAGTTYISGTSDHPLFDNKQTDSLTSKKGEYWLFNLTTREQFSNYFVSVELPKGSEISFIKVKGGFRLTDELVLISTGENIPIEVAVQYQIKNKDVGFSLPENPWLWILAAASILAVSYAFKKSREKTKFEKPEKLDIIKHTLTENQNKIIDALAQAKVPITQKQLQHRTNLPKATLSRNVEILSQKGIIVKQSRGMSNVIFLKNLT